MSGVGKSTLSSYAVEKLEVQGYSTLILEGDVVRDAYNIKLGFGREDVEKNNLNVASICEKERCKFDVILVSIISPIDSVRRLIMEKLSPDCFLVYIAVTVESLRARDPKGLYKKADNNEITDLVGYSKSNPYDVPENHDLMIDTSNNEDIDDSKAAFVEFVFGKLE
jgi:adenylylsulfate kinase-like enzyme